MPKSEEKKQLEKMPTPKQLEEMKLKDEGYVAAKEHSVQFLEGRRQAVFNIARHYHLDVDELFQEGYEVLLTCLRDYTPVFERNDGSLVKVMFTTFFGNRMESRAMEMRNSNPEYQARQAFTEKMSDEEKASFRSDPPLLVQHLDQESPMQEMLAGEASSARNASKDDVAMKISRDSFFEKTLNGLIAKETDEKKKAALLHVKVGGVYNFQEIALHFGVTDSRASQVLNELMDAFYVQRIINGDLLSVQRDFTRMKFNEKRAVRLLCSAMVNATGERQQEIQKLFDGMYESLAEGFVKAKEQAQEAKQDQPQKTAAETKKVVQKAKPINYDELFTSEENVKYPLVAVEIKSIKDLSIDEDFRFHTPEVEAEQFVFSEVFGGDDAKFPAVVTEDGYVIDGARRIVAANAEGRSDYMCIVRHVEDDLQKKLLRVMINLRGFKPTKVDLYYAIGALADLGLSQQKIADCIGTSRTNVLVYAKVRDKAGAKLRALFEDGLIQVTNASTCADLDENTQEELAAFIRRHGVAWSKGSKFNKLHRAAMENKIAELSSATSPSEEGEAVTPATEVVVGGAPSDVVSSRVVASLEKRVSDYETALKDAEVWSQRREGVINTQTEEIESYKSEIEALKKELDAAELMKFGSSKAVESELKELKKFFAVTERLSGAGHALGLATKDVRKLNIRRTHLLELSTLMDDVESKVNALRVEIVNVNRSLRSENADDKKQANS